MTTRTRTDTRSHQGRKRTRPDAASDSGSVYTDTYLNAYQIDLIPFVGYGTTNGITPAQTNVTTAYLLGYVGSSAADADDGDWIEWNFNCAAGTYSFTLTRPSFNTSGSYNWTIDGVSVGAADDAYGAGAFYNTAVVYLGIALTAGNHTIRLTVNGKNASSTDYRALVQIFDIVRTGA